MFAIIVCPDFRTSKGAIPQIIYQTHRSVFGKYLVLIQLEIFISFWVLDYHIGQIFHLQLWSDQKSILYGAVEICDRYVGSVIFGEIMGDPKTCFL